MNSYLPAAVAFVIFGVAMIKWTGRPVDGWTRASSMFGMCLTTAGVCGILLYVALWVGVVQENPSTPQREGHCSCALPKGAYQPDKGAS